MEAWVKNLNDLMLTEDENIDEMYASSTKAQGEDIGFINKKSGAGILARESGVLEGFAYYNLGFRFDPKYMTLSLFAPTIQLFCQNFKVYDHADESQFEALNKEYQEVLDMIGGSVNG
jgi:hypothetical protein